MEKSSLEEAVDGVDLYYDRENELYTAWDVETGVASCGSSRSEALAMLADALTLHESNVEPIEDEAAALRDLGLDPEEIEATREEHDDLPEFLY